MPLCQDTYLLWCATVPRHLPLVVCHRAEMAGALYTVEFKRLSECRGYWSESFDSFLDCVPDAREVSITLPFKHKGEHSSWKRRFVSDDQDLSRARREFYSDKTREQILEKVRAQNCTYAAEVYETLVSSGLCPQMYLLYVPLILILFIVAELLASRVPSHCAKKRKTGNN